MVCRLKCNCNTCNEAAISTFKELKRFNSFFEKGIQEGYFVSQKPEAPFYVYEDKNRKVEWYATQWYKCNSCGCLWELEEPDFPANGFVRKFPTGKYLPRGF